MFGEIMLDHHPSQLNFAREIAGMVARSVALLDAIEQTVTLLHGDTEILVFLANQAKEVTAKVTEIEPRKAIDPDGSISASLKKLCGQLERDYTLGMAKRNSARVDPQLTRDDGVEEAYTMHIAALADLHNAIEALRESMEIHDSRLSPVIGSYDNVDDLFSALESD